MTFILLLILFCALPLSVHAQDEVCVSPDRPGAGTGSEVLGTGVIQWETGFEVAHMLNMHLMEMPTTLFRFGVHPRIELRLEYTGTLAVFDHPDADPATSDVYLYTPEPLAIGAKFLLCDHRGGTLDKAWIPRTALMLNLGVPLTPEMANDLPVAGAVDLLFENDVTDWFSLGYSLGAHWIEWAPTPDIFATLGLNFEPIDRLGLFVESFNNFDLDAIRPDGTTYTHYDISLDFGITYAVHPRVQLDAYAGFNLYDSEPAFSSPKNAAFFGFGVSWLIHHPLKKN